jgi:hypothetical protein
MMETRMLLHYEDGRIEEIADATIEYDQRKLIVAERKEQFPVGTRVKLIALAQNVGGYDDRPNLPPGSTGEVSAEPDDFGSLPIAWDHGSSLAVTAHDKIVVYGDLTPEG